MSSDRPFIIIITCGKQKLQTTTPVPLDQLYTGKLTKTKIEVARLLASDDRIYVISGKFGLIPLKSESAYYDSLNRMPNRSLVESQIKMYNLAPDVLIVFIGQRKIYNFLSTYFSNLKNLISETKGSGDFTARLIEFRNKYKSDPSFREKFKKWVYEDIKISIPQKSIEDFFKEKPRLAFGYGFDPETLREGIRSFEFSHKVGEISLYTFSPELSFRIFPTLAENMKEYTVSWGGLLLIKGKTEIGIHHFVTDRDPQDVVNDINEGLSKIFKKYEIIPKEDI